MNNRIAGRTVHFRLILTLSFRAHKLDDEDGIIYGETYLTKVASGRIMDNRWPHITMSLREVKNVATCASRFGSLLSVTLCFTDSKCLEIDLILRLCVATNSPEHYLGMDYINRTDVLRFH